MLSQSLVSRCDNPQAPVLQTFVTLPVADVCIYVDISYFRYQERYWRKSVFEGIDLLKKTLSSVYGEGQVSLIEATYRWMCHHSKLSSNGEWGAWLVWEKIARRKIIKSMVQIQKKKCKTDQISKEVTVQSPGTWSSHLLHHIYFITVIRSSVVCL